MSILFWVKLVHTVVFVVESAAILSILYNGLFDVRGPGWAVAVISMLAAISDRYLLARVASAGR